MDILQIKALEQKTDDLIGLCEQLSRENRHLKAEVYNWHKEREQLVKKTELARTKVEAMISRLKSLEQGS